MRYLNGLLIALVLATSPVSAASFEDGASAFGRQDYAAAFKEFMPLAWGGDAGAQFFLGVMYANGQGVPKDDQQAVAWYRKAAEQGAAGAQLIFGRMYATGQGVPKDDQQAYFWWLLASASGDAASIRIRDLAEPRLTPQQRAAAQAQARDWRPTR